VPALAPFPVSAGDAAFAAGVPAALRAESDSAFDWEQAPNAKLVTAIVVHATACRPTERERAGVIA